MRSVKSSFVSDRELLVTVPSKMVMDHEAHNAKSANHTFLYWRRLENTLQPSSIIGFTASSIDSQVIPVWSPTTAPCWLKRLYCK